MPRPSIDACPVVAQVVAWERDVGRHDFMNRYSVQHVAHLGADYTLCGARIRWLYFSPGDSRRCPRCFELAAKRGYVNDYGDPIVPAER